MEHEDGMSAENAQREPTMEEILASIRRIISEEDKLADSGDVLNLQPPAPPPVAEAKQPITPPKPAPQSAPPSTPEPAAAPPPMEMFDEPEPAPPPRRPPEDEIVIMERERPAEPVAPPPPPVARLPEPEWTPPPAQKPLVSDPVASQTAGALGRLMGSMMVSTGNTLDDVVRELLKPMLKEWLDANLPQIVEAEVAKEIDRIRRMSR
jgi:cell pole-organizing protein PopZ